MPWHVEHLPYIANLFQQICYNDIISCPRLLPVVIRKLVLRRVSYFDRPPRSLDFRQIFCCSNDTSRKLPCSDWKLDTKEWNQVFILTPSVFLSSFLEVSARNPRGLLAYIINMWCLYYQMHSRRIRLSRGQSPAKHRSRDTCIYLGDTTPNAFD